MGVRKMERFLEQRQMDARDLRQLSKQGLTDRADRPYNLVTHE